MNESDLPVNALSQLQLRRRKFQRRCSVTEQSLRAARHVREILFREDCLHRQSIEEQEQHHEHHSVPALVEAVLVEAVSDEESSQRLPVQFFSLSDDGKHIPFQASWTTDKLGKPWQRNSLMALAAPFLLQDEKWGSLKDGLSAEKNHKRDLSCHRETSDSEDLPARERRQKKPRIE